VPDRLIEALRGGKITEVRAAAKADPKAAVRARSVCEAAQRAFVPALELLVSLGGDVNGVFKGYRPIQALLQESPHEAGSKPDAERVRCLEWLLAHGAGVELPGGWPSARPILIAAFVGTPEYVDILRRAGAAVDDFAAAALGDVSRVRKLLAKRPAFARERDPQGLTALHCAAASRFPEPQARLEIATMLLDAGAALQAKVKSWLHEVDAVYFAASTKNLELFRLFLERGADVDKALTHGAWNGEDLAPAALEFGAHPDRAVADKQPLLNNLIRWGQIEPALRLVKAGASPNLADEKGWTALHQAVSRGNERMVRALLEAGADRARKDKDGVSPGELARVLKRPKMLEVLEA
jgi:ankyrin repeat protein